jgi:hypothetical protein
VGNPQMVALAVRVLMAIYAYTLVLSTGQVAACETRKPGECGGEWTQAYTVAAGITSTLWAYVTDSPQQLPGGAKRPSPRTSNASPSDAHRQRSFEDGA